MSSLHHLSFYYTFYSPTNLLWRLRLLLIWYNLCHAWNGIKIWSWNINFTKLHKAFRKWIIHFLDICHNCMCVLMCLNINIPIQLFQKLLTTVYTCRRKPQNVDNIHFIIPGNLSFCHMAITETVILLPCKIVYWNICNWEIFW